MIKSIYKTYRILATHAGIDAKSGLWIVAVKSEAELNEQVDALLSAGYESVTVYQLDI